MNIASLAAKKAKIVDGSKSKYYWNDPSRARLRFRARPGECIKAPETCTQSPKSLGFRVSLPLRKV